MKSFIFALTTEGGKHTNNLALLIIWRGLPSDIHKRLVVVQTDFHCSCIQESDPEYLIDEKMCKFIKVIHPFHLPKKTFTLTI